MTTDRLQAFFYEGDITIRVIDRNGVPWFVAADLCRALGIANPRDSVSSLDDDEKDVGNTDTLGGNQEVLIVSESGLFALIFRSRKPNAVQFRKWVTAEVLPAIRKTGSYNMPAQPSEPDALRAWMLLPLPERRLVLELLANARLVWGRPAAAYMWQWLGLPVPPIRILPTWAQLELLLPGANMPI
jgi:prophage antirepressor-like protein